MLNLSENELSKLSRRVIDFYEKTANYNLKLTLLCHNNFAENQIDSYL